MNVLKSRIFIAILLILVISGHVLAGVKRDNTSSMKKSSTNNTSAKEPVTENSSTNIRLEDTGKQFNEVMEYLKKPKDLRSVTKEEKRSAFKRFEITFFISFALLYNVNMVLMRTWLAIEKQDWGAELGSVHWSYIHLSSIVLSTYIASYDVYNVFIRDKKERRVQIPIVEARF